MDGRRNICDSLGVESSRVKLSDANANAMRGVVDASMIWISPSRCITISPASCEVHLCGTLWLTSLNTTDERKMPFNHAYVYAVIAEIASKNLDGCCCSQ
ncbi:hypothetical protein TWF225_003068 [Orbilia oligospora]|nr:hypothetical protein TWF751_002782 [Orbilia oligospora]KAF3189333.1 hypothetical protein TWF225_003068 [Orbilia oligospora]KAF3244578.1 hypothetical protein TWF128_009682 [Orbilia oligospora]KAF3264902.1 hypothetical protein TWF217_003059 [Orbilia oligospora]KAF3294586.1 hypothetical protein TWF132_003083 [Orbilia oligospora]